MVMLPGEGSVLLHTDVTWSFVQKDIIWWSILLTRYFKYRFFLNRKVFSCWMWWCLPLIPPLRGFLWFWGQPGLHCELQDSLEPYLKMTATKEKCLPGRWHNWFLNLNQKKVARSGGWEKDYLVMFLIFCLRHSSQGKAWHARPPALAHC